MLILNFRPRNLERRQWPCRPARKDIRRRGHPRGQEGQRDEHAVALAPAEPCGLGSGDARGQRRGGLGQQPAREEEKEGDAQPAEGPGRAAPPAEAALAQ